MDSRRIMCRKEACSCLQLKEDATEDEIKKAYRNLAKKYHPDANPRYDTKSIYIRIQEAYEYLEKNPYTDSIAAAGVKQNSDASTVFYQNMQQRPVRIFQSDEKLREKQRMQQKFQEERRKALFREEKQKKQSKKAAPAAQAPQKLKEEEALDKIRAIWIAETVRRQIEQDKLEREKETKRELYQAFLKHRINAENELRSKGGTEYE